MHRESCECSTEGLEIDRVPQTMSVLEKAQWEEYYPLNAIDNRNAGAPVEFEIKGHGEDFLDLAQTYVYIKLKITQTNGTDLAADTQTTPVNNFLHSMFNEIDLSLNGKIISPSTNTYPYRAYLETLLTYRRDTLKKSIKASNLWIKDEGGKMDTGNPHEDDTTAAGYNASLRGRHNLIAESKEVELFDRLHLDLFQQKNYLVNGVDVRLRFNRASTPFCLFGNADGKIKISSMMLFVRKVRPMPGIINRANALLNSSTAKYPLRRVEVKSFTIPAGTRSKITDNVFAGQLPKRVFLGMVSNTAFNGSIDTNPFNFQHFNCTKVEISLNGETQNTRPFEPDFANNSYLRSYLSLYQALGRIGEDWAPDIGQKEYGEGFTLWGYDFTPDQNAQSFEKFHLIKTGNMRIELQFSAALVNTINCIVYGEFDNVLEINKQREVSVDY